MLDNAVCYPLPAVTEHFIRSNFSHVHFIYSAHSYKARHQRTRVYLSYSDPCFGHHHYRVQPKHERHGTLSSAVKASCATSRGGEEESEQAKLMRPSLPIDEVGAHDQQVLDSLWNDICEGAEQPATPQAGSRMHMESLAVRGCVLGKDSDEALELDSQTALQYASWYRRACVHSADMVFVLSSAYSAPPDSTSSDGGTALNDDSSLTRSQLYLTSLFEYAQRTSTSAVKDDQIRADQHALIMHAGRSMAPTITVIALGSDTLAVSYVVCRSSVHVLSLQAYKPI